MEYVFRHIPTQKEMTVNADNSEKARLAAFEHGWTHNRWAANEIELVNPEPSEPTVNASRKPDIQEPTETPKEPESNESSKHPKDNIPIEEKRKLVDETNTVLRGKRPK